MGAVCWLPGALMIVGETPSTGYCSVQDPVPFGMGSVASVDNSRARNSGLSDEGPPGSAGISPGLVCGGDFDRTGPYPFAHGYTTEVRGLKSCGGVEECD